MAGETVTFEALARDALDANSTDELFAKHERLFTEVCACWLASGVQSVQKIAAFGRIVPLSPRLAEHAERFLATVSNASIFGSLSIVSNQPGSSQPESSKIPDSDLHELLLGTFRLLSLDCRSFAKYVRPVALESLIRHRNITVRYLAVRTLCLYVHAADHATEEMVSRHVGEKEAMGAWEGRMIDYRFLGLWEEKRWKDLSSRIEDIGRKSAQSVPNGLLRQLSPYSVNIGDTLLPRLGGAPSQMPPLSLISTKTTELNLRTIAQALLGTRPLLLTGLAGSGKTLLVRHFAGQLNKLESMITLHLNEQSDAKLLVGMYATGAKPGTFSWRPGVLTKAVREGRWILIEDLDRAPNEVISTLLPLIERGNLLIPSRGENIRAAQGFRIIATMRSTLNSKGQQIVPRQNMIGHRFWNSITVHMPELEEFHEIMSIKYAALKGHTEGILRAYARLLSLFAEPKFASDNGTSLRALTPRDLLKWCDRIGVLLGESTVFTAAQTDDIFMEAYDCFAGSLRSETARARVMACVAEELHINPQRRDHLLLSRDVKLAMPKKSGALGLIQIGRARLPRHKSSRKPASGRPFSANGYTLRLLEKIAVAVDRQEPLLLVGETGTGKTTCIQYLAEQLGRKLVAFNLSQQSESGDLLGGYKPVNVRSLVIPLKDEFDEIFGTTFSRKNNQDFQERLGKEVAKGRWMRVCNLWRKAVKMVDAARKEHESQTSSPDPEGGQPRKKRRVDSLPSTFPEARWEKFALDLNNLEAQLKSGSDTFAFSFLEGNIVKAVRNGDWILLDEINLASSDTLEALADLLGGGPDGTSSILLTETGNVERVVAHPNFRVFAAMNPATDVGKKDLPPGIRSRFTELYVESPDNDAKSLRDIVESYLGAGTSDPTTIKIALDVTNLYLEIQRLAKANMLVDGADQKAHFSLRTLTRTLSYAREMAPLTTLRRALYEGFHMSFLTFLGKASEDLVAPLIKQHLFQKANVKTELGKPLAMPQDGRLYVKQGHYWLRQGSGSIEQQPHYIITPFIERNMKNLIRAASTRRYPVLIQGPTSSGKTSMIEYLAKKSGNKFVRINNHEHTDLQEYLGSYISGTDGKLQFQEGILVRALREGHWIVLDELNLAPTDVLEALNRLLDDNRELLIPETQEVVRPHEDFMLFATQNPAGLYGGRKVLSRAFRNRFLELHFDDIPVEELTEILHKRTMIPESWCKRIVKVYEELSTLRQESRLFEQKSFATLRDLFRWAQRKADTIHELALNGYMLLAERVRKEDERQAVKKIIETVMSKNGPRVTIDEEALFSEDLSPEIKLCKEKMRTGSSPVWTRAMRRLFVLVAHAVRNNEPVLLVGETGCGKTTVCQMLADAVEKQLHIVNAHQNTETGDLIGAQRPVRNRATIEDVLTLQVISVLDAAFPEASFAHLNLPQLLAAYDELDRTTENIISPAHRDEITFNRVKAAALFEWADGSLIHAMKTGQYFLLDEISLADDSVLERLNSVLESSRTLLLAEKGPVDSLITASDGFQFLATMNPGGDYGKRELSAALRNRFTEIWVPALSDVEDILQIVRSKLKPALSQYAGSMVSFAQWFNEKYNTSVTSSISIRDILAWATFANDARNDDPIFGVVHGAAMVFIDTLGANPSGLLGITPTSVDEERQACLQRLSKLLGIDVADYYFEDVKVVAAPGLLQLGPFSVERSGNASIDVPKTVSALMSSPASNSAIPFSFEAPTTRSNAMRVVRALQLPKPILLEGNPGVGKTTLVTAIAKAIDKPLTRLNLSEQTDLMDLFGSDVPVEGGQAGTFAWRDAPFLKAMKNGDWVLLDEMNLASQSVLEGLNAVLDHRGEVFISELDQTFHKHADFRVFAAQNPHHQGGGRKGLPASFVNRFTVVYADVFRPEDLALICSRIFPDIESGEVRKLISFVAELDEQVVQQRSFGALGSPWEFNLRDTLRWLHLVASEQTSGTPRDFLDSVFVQRFRSIADRSEILKLFANVYGSDDVRQSFYHNLSPTSFQVGLCTLSRNAAVIRPDTVSALRPHQLNAMEALMVSMQQNWPVILVGPPGSGKTTLVSQLASFVGADLATFFMNADIDAMDLVGGYEQADPSREIYRYREQLQDFVRRKLAVAQQPSQHLLKLLEIIESGAKLIGPDILFHLHAHILEEPTSECATALLQEATRLSSLATDISGAQFQWVDGILIQALEQGKWLVLDNANLCSSSVLDRLNSLLEPNGYLNVNEHSTPDGEARIVRPHPDFRIFLTMDPRFGELSRAMRNRAVEICLLPDETTSILHQQEISTPAYPLESSTYRFRNFVLSTTAAGDTHAISFDHLSPADEGKMQSFCAEAAKGLCPFEVTLLNNGDITSSRSIHTNGNNPSEMHAQETFLRYSQFLTETWSRSAAHFQGQLRSPIGITACLIPYHPLNNEFALLYNTTTKATGIWLSRLYDMLMDLYNMRQALHSLPSTKFERRAEKQKLPTFLDAYLKRLLAWAELLCQHQDAVLAADIAVLRPLQVLFWAFMQLAEGTGFDRATFQTYLKMLDEYLLSLSSSTDAATVQLKAALTKDLSVFGTGVQLKSGLSMERIWRHFKPRTAKSLLELQAVLKLEELADRLDATMWKSNLSIDQMAQVRERFGSSLSLVREQGVDATELILSLEGAVRELESSANEDDAAITPYFEEDFEGICQLHDIVPENTGNSQPVSGLRAKASLLARRPTKSLSTSNEANPAGRFSGLERSAGLSKQGAEPTALQERFHVSLLQKLDSADEVTLSQLNRFEQELDGLSQHVSFEANNITEGHRSALLLYFQSLVNELVAAHSDVVLSARTNGLIPKVQTTVPEAFRSRLQETLTGCVNLRQAYHADANSASRAWVELGLAGLYLYIPNYPFDPALRPMLERNFFNERKQALEQNVAALRRFQHGFTGQHTSFRIRHTQEQVEALGTEPPVPAIVRPAASALDALQGEFSSLLGILQHLFSKSVDIKEASRDDTLRQNILRAIQRLDEGYRSYDDITGPAVGFLVCLYVGLTLAAQVETEDTSITKSLAYVTHHTPFFGLSYAYDSASAITLIEGCEQALNDGHNAFDLRWHALHSAALIKCVEPGKLAEANTDELVQNIFSSLYGEWKSKLTEDQEKEAKNTSLYTYRGDDETVEEEDRELFPDYEEHNTDVLPKASSTVREDAIRLADIHADIFLGGTSADASAKRLMSWSAKQMSKFSGDGSHGTNLEGTFPALLLALEQKADALSSSGAGQHYNFYFDANIPQAKQLIALVHKIQFRYQQIRRIWPEHATLSDVLRTCDEALAFRHVDPVAKFITKAEKLHGYMYEWQRVASKEFSTANLYDDLTKLLVSWRQLELTTWSRLFDIEIEKAQDNAKSWFFVAYETIVAASESLEDEKTMKAYAKDLLKSLEGFFAATTLGQFQQRVKLLRQFCGHIALRARSERAFTIIHLAISNFTAYFLRLEKPVQEAVTKGRQNLEKEVNNVIKLASWKDTNIDALKQSAKASHRKLSKLVRKFRALLNQPVSGILRAGLPEEQVVLNSVDMEHVSTAVPPNALQLCEAKLTDFAARPTRFKNLAATVSIMRTKSCPSVEAVEGAAYIQAFITDLETSATQLQKATPATLTEENKEEVQHLKAQKRKLFADTMKELKQMGFRPNLSSNVLAKQDELSTVLASLPAVAVQYQDGARASDYNLHKSLSIITQVRDVAKEHSGDLTSNDVNRSIGYLESLLHATIQQRGTLSKATEGLQQLQLQMSCIRTLSSPESRGLVGASDDQNQARSTMQSGAKWLAVILQVAADVVAAQANMAKIVTLDGLIADIRSWCSRFHELTESFNTLPTLPTKIWSSRHTEIEENARRQFADFRGVYNNWIEQYTLPRVTLKQIAPWILDDPSSTSEGNPNSPPVNTAQQSKDIFKALDIVLASVQDVEAALKDIPASMEEASWLTREDQAFTAAITALRSSQITRTLTDIMKKVHFLQDEDHSGIHVIAALFASILPLFEQYVSSYVYLLDRFTALHTSTTKLLYRLSKSFIQVGAQGFCTPQEKSAGEQAGKDDKLESGTGLGEGEGAEDISKDVEDDEDLEDLAQQEKGEREGSIEENEDAVDMGEQEMEGEMGDVADKEDQEGERGDDEDDAESQVGSVDDLGPSAVDEKMWDEGGEENDDAKEKEGDQGAGTENQDEQVAAPEKKNESKGDEGDEERQEQGEDDDAEMEGEDQEENVGVGETEKMDPHAKEEETLDLPDELNMEGNDEQAEGEDDDIDDMDMDEGEEELDAEAGAEPAVVDDEIGPQEEDAEEKDTTGHAPEDENMEEDQEPEGEEPVDDDIIPLPDDENSAEDAHRNDDQDAGEPNADLGAGVDANEKAHQDQNQDASASAANQEEGTRGEDSTQKQESTAEDGQLGQTSHLDAAGRGEDTEESPELQPFKKIGDTLEKWYNQQRQIRDARKQEEKDQSMMQEVEKEINMADAEFEHLPDDETQGDTQALGTATEDQAKALEKDMGMAVDEDETAPAVPEDKDEELQGQQDQDMEMEDAGRPEDQEQQQQPQGDGRPEAFVGEQQKHLDLDEDHEMADAVSAVDELSDTSSVQDVETQLDATHIDVENTLPSPETARALWLHHESATHSLSQQLTEHLRLILAPTLATKLRGDFRTGKRLNLKRIIPYIASGYKRDKIWLRRSQPSKRNYQIMIALDDSKSMAESGASNLALKTLALITRSLSMLEVGEVSVVGFGSDITIAHEFDKPFTSESGVNVFEKFGFGASKTNVRGLVEKSLGLFSEARRRGVSSAGEDLWQLMLIVSDGICDSHAEIQRLVRQAKEDRVMLVFIIVDATAGEPSLHSTDPRQPPTSTATHTAFSSSEIKAKEKTSILDLQSVEISKEGKVVRWKYMDQFPFRYYLVVRDVRELPGVLAGALRQWFAEVVESGG